MKKEDKQPNDPLEKTQDILKPIVKSVRLWENITSVIFFVIIAVVIAGVIFIYAMNS